MRGRAARALVPALAVGGLLAVVALAATGSTSHGTSRVRPPAASLLDTILSLGLLAVVAGGVLLAYGLMQRREIAEQIATGRYPRTSIVGWLVFVFLFTAAAYWRLSIWRPKQAPSGMEDVVPPNRGPTPGGNPTAVDTNTYQPHIAWIPVAAVLVLVAAAVVAYVVSERRRRPRAGRDESVLEEAAAVIDEALDDLRAESDPRRAVIAAYVRLERVLAANGLPRRRTETEEEYLGRMLGSLDVSSRAAKRLTVLFERARFSPHAMDVAMKEEAIDALESIRDELRARSAVDIEVDSVVGAPV